MTDIILHNGEPTPFYLRLSTGECGFANNLDDAMKVFASDVGYRLTIEAGGVEVCIRRASEPQPDNSLEKFYGPRYDATVEVRPTDKNSPKASFDRHLRSV